MSDDFDRIKSALSDIAHAVTAMRMGPLSEYAVTLNLDRIAGAVDVIKRHADDAESDLRRAKRVARGET
jgi:hypothetical protein